MFSGARIVDSSNDMHRDDKEREFIHKLSTPIGTALFLLEAVLESVKSSSFDAREGEAQMRTALGAIERAKDIINERRADLQE